MATYYQIIQCIYKQWIVEKTQELIQHQYIQNTELRRLAQPLTSWTNRDYHTLSALCEIEESSLKRILGYAGKTAQHISQKNEAKIIQYLGYGSDTDRFHRDLIRKMYQYLEEEEEQA